MLLIAGGKAAAQRDLGAVQVKHGPGNAAYGGSRGGLAVVADACRGGHHGSHFAAPEAVVLDSVVIFHADELALLGPHVLLRTEDDRGGPRNGEHVCAARGELAGHIAVGAIDHGDDHDDRRHAHDYAQESEDSAHLVAPQRLQREFNGLGKQHDRAVLQLKVATGGWPAGKFAGEWTSRNSSVRRRFGVYSTRGIPPWAQNGQRERWGDTLRQFSTEGYEIRGDKVPKRGGLGRPQGPKCRSCRSPFRRGPSLQGFSLPQPVR